MLKNLFLNHKLLLFIICSIFTFSLVFNSCDDDVTNTVKNTVTRLYVSDSDTNNQRVGVFDPANDPTSVLSRNILTNQKDGNGVWVDTDNNVLIQVGRNLGQPATIKVFDNASTINDSVTPVASFTDLALTNAREISYDNTKKILYVVNLTAREIRVYDNPRSKGVGTTVSANRIINIGSTAWGIFFNKENDRLFVAVDNTDSVLIINNISLKNGNINPDRRFQIVNNSVTKKLHGVIYSNKLDILIVTDVGNAMGTIFDGSIYTFENFTSTVLNSSVANVIPTKTITGAVNTKLRNPVDVDFDDRDGKREIYIAEKAGKNILIFNLSDSGDVAPKISKDFGGPSGGAEDIFLDIFTPIP